jgi:hypothetical protein
MKFLLLAIIVCLCSCAMAQDNWSRTYNEDDQVWALDQTSVPDAPSTTKQTTCTENNGKPCPEWLHKMIGQYPPAPYPSYGTVKHAGFFTLGNPNGPQLRSGKTMLKSKVWWVGNGLMWAAVVTDVRYTHGARENAWSEYPAVAGVSALSYVTDRWIDRSFSVGEYAYTIQHYVRDAFKGR